MPLSVCTWFELSLNFLTKTMESCHFPTAFGKFSQVVSHDKYSTTITNITDPVWVPAKIIRAFTGRNHCFIYPLDRIESLQ